MKRGTTVTLMKKKWAFLHFQGKFREATGLTFLENRTFRLMILCS